MRLATLLFVGSCALVSGARSISLGRGDDVFEIEMPQNGRGDPTRGRVGRQYDGHVPEHRQTPIGNGGQQRFVNQFPYKLGRQGQNHGRRQPPRQQAQRGLSVSPPNYSHPQQRGGGPGQGQNGQDIDGNPTQPPQPTQENQSPYHPRPQSPLPRGNSPPSRNGPFSNGNTPRQLQGPSFPGPDRSASSDPNDYVSGRQSFGDDHGGYDDGQGQPANNGQNSGSEVPNLPVEDQDGPPGEQGIGSQGGDALQVSYHLDLFWSKVRHHTHASMWMAPDENFFNLLRTLKRPSTTRFKPSSLPVNKNPRTTAAQDTLRLQSALRLWASPGWWQPH